MDFRAVSFLVGFTLGFSSSGLALAHGVADWIRQAPETAFCCGDQDCMPLPPGAVVRVPTGGYLLNGEWFPEIGGIRRGESFSRVFASIDSGYWACFRHDTAAGYGHSDLAEEWRRLPARCLFVPTLGM
jgi:hypothetical protein